MPQMVEQLVESDEVELHSQVAKLLRVQDDQWKARGLGFAKLLMHKKNGKIRFVLRQEETTTIVNSFYVMNDCALEPHPNSDSTWLWEGYACSDGAPQPAQLALTFASKDVAAEFWDAFKKGKEAHSRANSCWLSRARG